MLVEWKEQCDKAAKTVIWMCTCCCLFMCLHMIYSVHNANGVYRAHSFAVCFFIKCSFGGSFLAYFSRVKMYCYQCCLWLHFTFRSGIPAFSRNAAMPSRFAEPDDDWSDGCYWECQCRGIPAAAAFNSHLSVFIHYSSFSGMYPWYWVEAKSCPHRSLCSFRLDTSPVFLQAIHISEYCLGEKQILALLYIITGALF